MKKLNNVTIIIVTYLTKKNILLNCLKSIDKNVKVIVVENSKKFVDEKYFLKRFSNLKILCSGINLGYGAGNNFGLSNVKTQYALILNPDIICDTNFFKNLNKLLNTKKIFSIIGCQYLYDKIHMPAGFFNKKKDRAFHQSFLKERTASLIKVDWVTGCSMLINLKKFKDKNIFDVNFFLFFEEFDLCRSVINKGDFVYSSSDLLVDHLHSKGSIGSNNNLKTAAIKIRNWHWTWSLFYFYKKKHNFFYALFKTFSKLLKAFFFTIYFTVFFDQNNRNTYLYRFLGLFSAIVGRQSNYRLK
jgi:N-acetylglucosaminyl-diphospho-decaprenol L-rhamnosyltransferase|tara:strand:+ start:1038 stop:1940 length:903 start_codon:yes stop_codon:yes gene_type:complete